MKINLKALNSKVALKIHSTRTIMSLVKRISVVCPAFNESEGIESFLVEFKNQLIRNVKNVEWELIVVDDGSSDDTWDILTSVTMPNFIGIKLLTNSGHQQAIQAGLKSATGELIITMDSDFQHPFELIPKMIEIQKESKVDIVQAVVESRAHENILRRNTAKTFYYLLKRLSSVQVKKDAGDFRLMTARVVRVLNDLPEREKIIRFLIPSLGFQIEYLNFKPPKRRYGSSKYSLGKLYRLARASLFGFSSAPLRAVSGLGLLTTCATLLWGFSILGLAFKGISVPGWASLMFAILALSSIQILIMSISARFLVEILDSLRGRPTYIIDEIIKS